MGGMGFRDLGIFNQALLAKQGWRLLTNPDSLVYKVLQARYFKNGDFLSANRGFDPSYVWRSIWGAKALLIEGLKWRVGDGRRISVWEDAWLPGENTCRVPVPNIASPANLLVADLINHDEKCWDETVVRQHLVDADASLALSLPLSLRNVGDSQYWAYTKDGVYTTKSGYWLGRLGHIRGWELRFGGSQAELWKKVWDVNGPPKLRNFLWKACTGALATLGRLQQRHIRNNGNCDLCNGGEESIIHAIFECPTVKNIWDCSSFAGILVDAPTVSFEDRLMWVSAKLDKADFLSFASMTWAAWAIRNAAVFNDPWQNVEIGVAGFVKLAEDYAVYTGAVSRPAAGVNCKSASCWVPPAAGVIRVNSDAAVLNGNAACLGAVIRDDSGKLLAAAVKRGLLVNDVLTAEAMAARLGLETARRLGFTRVELQCDAINVVNAICKGRHGKAPVDLIFDDIFSLSVNFEFFSCSHVRRAGNCVAHLAARSCPMDCNDFLYVDSFPQGLIDLAEIELIY